MSGLSSAARAWPAVVLAAAVTLSLASCAQDPTDSQPPPRGLSRTDAIAITSKQAQTLSTTPVKLVSASVGPVGRLSPGLATTPVGPASRWVWKVVFAGTFPPPSCGPAPTVPGQIVHCPSAQNSVSVIVDYLTGRWLTTGIPAGSLEGGDPPNP